MLEFREYKFEEKIGQPVTPSRLLGIKPFMNIQHGYSLPVSHQVFTQSITLKISSRSGRLAAPGMTHPEAGLLPICEPVVTLEELPVSETQQGDNIGQPFPFQKRRLVKKKGSGGQELA